MGNGSQRASQAGTLCVEWACRLTHSIAVSGSMKPRTASPSRLLLDNSRQRNGKAPQHPPPLRSGKLPLKRKSPQKRLQSISESLRFVFSSNRVCSDCGMLHNTDYDLCGTERECANRLRSYSTLTPIELL